MTLIIYCAFCYLYEIGFAIALRKDGKELAIISISLAPIMMPIELGMSIYCLLRKK